MADNITFQTTTATPASGTVVGTDEVSIGGVAQHVQRVKLVDGTNGGTDLIAGDATNGLDVDITRIAAGASADIGAVADAAVITDTTGSLSGKLRGLVKWAFERMPASLGQKAKTASFPVVIASDQDALAVTLTSTTITGTATVDSELPAAAALADNAANPTAPAVGAFGMVWDGATWDRAPGTAADGLLVNLGANNDVTVSGVATAANQTTMIGHLDGVEGLLTTIDADTGTIAGAVAGTEMQVDIVAALPAGTNNIGDVDVLTLPALPAGTNNIGDVDVASIAAGDNNIGNVDIVSLPALPAGTNNIGDVDVLSVVPGTGATNLGKAEDAQHTSGDVGVMALGVRQDADAAFGADGDYGPMQLDANGYLKVNIKAGAGSGGTASTDDAAFTAASGSGTPIMGFVTADSVDSGDVGVVGMLANRQLKVTLYDSGGVELAVGGGTQYTEDAAAAANPVGNAMILVREDARAGSLTTTDGDNVAARGNNKGELYVKTTDSDALLTTIDADTSTLAGAVAGTEMQVDVVGALPAGTNNIGDVDVLTLPALPAGNNNIGDVDVASIAAGDNNIGNVDIASIAAGDNNIGNVDIVTLPNVTIGTMANLTESLVDDAAFTPATSRVLPAGFTFDDSTPDSVNEGDIGAARMSANRNIYTTLRDAAGNERGLNVDASGNIAVTQSGTWNVGTVTTVSAVTAISNALPAGDNNIGNVDLASAIPAGTNNIGDVDIVSVPAPLSTTGGGTEATALRVTVATDSTGVLSVDDNGGALTVDNGGTFAVQVTSIAAGNNNIGDVDVASIAAGDNNIGNVDVVTMPGVVGTVADDGTTPGSPVMIGGKAVETDGTDPTSVSAEDDVAILRTDRNRRLLVNTVHPRMWVGRENHTTAQTNNELQAAPGANLSLYITDIIMSTDVATNIKLVRDTGGTPADIAGPFYFAANGGIAMPLVTPIRVPANQNVGFTGGATGNFTVEIHGYTAP